MRILVVEDEVELATTLVNTLEDELYAVDLARDGNTADELASVNPYDLILLDWGLPGISGLTLLASWRAAGRHTPVLMLTGRVDVPDRVCGLNTGADDYLTKPFSFSELLARVRSLLRRRDAVISTLEAGDVRLDRASRRVTVGDEEVSLAPKEFGVLEYLLTRAGEPVTRSELAEHVWNESFDAMSNVIDVVVYRLRKKIDRGPRDRLLHTVKGVGYILRRPRG